MKEGCVLGLAGARRRPPSTETSPRLQLLNSLGAVRRAAGGDLNSTQARDQEGELFLLDTHLWVTEAENGVPWVTVLHPPPGRREQGEQPGAAAGACSGAAVHGACPHAGGRARGPGESPGGRPDSLGARGGEWGEA